MNHLNKFLKPSLIGFFLLIGVLLAQNKPAFVLPLNIPIELSGNFCEIRPGHFHSGIDIKTQKREGFAVFSIDDGHVSRIRISSGGYGFALYINHPSGHTSVYAHLKKFNDDIMNLVRSTQYKSKRSQVDIDVKPGELSIKKGDMIALSGNSGGSEAPHLHFEIRETLTGKVLNPLDFYPNLVKDTVKPKIPGIYTYRNSYQQGRLLDLNNNSLENPLKLGSGPLAFGIETFDKVNNSDNTFGIKTLSLFVDDQLHYRFHPKKLDFDKTRYINAHLDYAAFINKRIYLQRCFLLPGNRLTFYTNVKNQGWVDIQPNKTYKIDLESIDEAGNSSKKTFYVFGTDSPEIASSTNTCVGKSWTIRQGILQDVKQENWEIRFLKGSFYQDIKDFFVHERGAKFHIYNPDIPIHHNAQVRLNASSFPIEKRNKLLAIREEKEKKIAHSGKIDENWFVFKMRNFGIYSLQLDTIAPTIKQLNKKQEYREKEQLSFLVKDELSNISDYQLFIDNQWTPLYFDAKNDTLILSLDDKRIAKGKRNLKLVVYDSVKNETTYTTSFTKK